MRGKYHAYTVHGVFYSFSEDEDLAEIAKKETLEVFNEVNPDWFSYTVGEGWETVQPGEAKGIGFYYLHVLLDDKVVKKVHLRRRLRGVSFLDIVAIAVKAVLREIFH